MEAIADRRLQAPAVPNKPSISRAFAFLWISPTESPKLRLSATFLGSVLDNQPESIEVHGNRLKSHLRAFRRLCDENDLSFADISKIAGTEINLASFDAEFENTRYLELMQILTS